MARKLSDAMSEADPTNVDPMIIQACLAEYTQTDTQIKRLAQQQAAMLKRYENQGVNTKSIKNTHRSAKRDKAEARAQIQSDIRYHVICGILNPANDEWTQAVTQTSLFGEEDKEFEPLGTVSPDLARARAHSDGYNSGRHGGEASHNPFQAGSEQFVAWHQGMLDGQSDRALRGNGTVVKQADTTSRRGRGRPAGSRNKGNGADAEEAAGHA